MYRPEWFQEQAGGRNVLQIALDLHMAVTGSGEMSPREMQRDASLIEHVIREWKKPSGRDQCSFDYAVHSLLYSAYAEYASTVRN
jgi:hypothetical protein